MRPKSRVLRIKYACFYPRAVFLTIVCSSISVSATTSHRNKFVLVGFILHQFSRNLLSRHKIETMQKKSFKRCESNTVAFYQTLPFSGSVRRSDVLQVIESDGEEDIDSGVSDFCYDTLDFALFRQERKKRRKSLPISKAL